MGVSHVLKCGVQLRRKGADQGGEREESVGQFNLIGFVDDLSLFAQTLGGAQALLEAPEEGSIGVHGARSDFLGTLNGVQVLGGMGHTNRGYVKYERKDF
jgi:hypothetical protein